MKSIIKDTIALTLITLVAGLLLGMTYEVTKEPIAAARESKKQEAYEKVFSGAKFELVKDEDSNIKSEFENAGYPKMKLEEVREAVDDSGAHLGYVFSLINPEGYGGDIKIAIGISSDQTVNGISFLEISETPGLGLRANSEEFTNQFKEKKTEGLECVKDGSGSSDDSKIDALSGATITSTAVVNTVNAAIAAAKYLEGGK